MYKKTWIILLLSMFASSVIQGCGNDSDSDDSKTPGNCQLIQTDCTLQGKTLDTINCICVDSGIPTQNCPLTEAMCASAGKKLNAVNCVCVDSQTSQNCQLTQGDCAVQGKSFDAVNCICVDSGIPTQNCSLTEAMCASAGKKLDAVNCTCVDSQTPQNCQITQADCASQGKTLDATNCTCVESSTAQECKTAGFVKCGSTCIDPKTSNTYCGANENCENYTACKDTETCFEGRCRPTKCEPDEHFYEVICEKDSVDNCGEHRFKCAEQVEGWKSGDCTDKVCTPSACAAGRHPFENTCEPDEVNHCGNHDTDCSIEIAGWQDGTCENGTCQVSACQKGLHLYENGCETDDLTNCGTHGIACSLSINGWKAGHCIDATCKVSECAEGMHVYDNACEVDTVENCGVHDLSCANTVAGWKSGACTQGKCEILQCIDGFHVDAKTNKCVQDTNDCCGASCTKCTSDLMCTSGECRSQCKIDERYCGGECVNIKTNTTNCGECGHDCNDEMPENGQTMICSGGSCQLTACIDDHHIVGNTCEADSETACGAEAKDCTADAWWDSGDCIDSKCIPQKCKGDYHLATNELGENWCEPNNDLNCGEHDFACQGGQICVAGRCLGNTICDGVLRNTLTDLDYCGDCNTRCNDGLICDQGQCKLGIGTAYCSGSKVTMGTIDRCSSCTDKCADSLICQNNACIAGAGTTHCSGATINTLANIDHCGSCDHKCADGLICSEGTCKSGNGLMYCSDVKVDSTNDSANCGQCGKMCGVGQICKSGDCITGTGATYCDGKYANTATNALNCGQCDFTCPTGKSCRSGGCITDCSGINTSLMDDSANCGSCGNKCAVGKTCEIGVCNSGTGLTYCDGASRNTSNDSANCGQCRKMCGVGQICSDGVCTSGVGTTYCDGVSRNTFNDSANCGQCGKVCGVGEICSSGVCIEGTGATYCNDASRNTSNDPANCGQCELQCADGKICKDGVCKDGIGTTYCKGNRTNTSNDLSNCGQCDLACHNGQKCADGTCQCTEGRYDCDGLIDNGCESTVKCECVPGITQTCWNGNPQNRQKGICRDGTQTCDASGLFWGPCMGDVYPSVTCNDKGVYIGGDQNCNGVDDTTEECVSNCDLIRSEFSNIGCEFWGAYLDNFIKNAYSNHTFVLSNPNDAPVSIYIFDKAQATDTTAIPVKTMTIGPLNVVAIEMNNNGYNMCQGSGILPNAYRIRASLPISAYQFNPFGNPEAHSNDASLLLPTNVLGKQYIGMTWQSESLNDHRSYITIIAPQPGKTLVSVTTTSQISATETTSIKITSTQTQPQTMITAMSKGGTYQFTLNQFEVLTLMAPASTAHNQTGTLITADKKIAVFGGSRASYVPANASCCRDHIEEQLFPTQAWGKSYLAARAYSGGVAGDFWVITARYDNTTITLTKGLKNLNNSNADIPETITLNAGQTYPAFETRTPFEIRADKPISVGQFLPSQTYNKYNNPDDPSKQIGDPSFILTVPYEQYRSDYDFMVPTFDTNYITIIAPKNATVTYDGNIITESDYIDTREQIGDSSFYVGYIRVQPGVHRMTADMPFGLYSYGYNNMSSYGFPIGLDLKNIDPN